MSCIRWSSVAPTTFFFSFAHEWGTYICNEKYFYDDGVGACEKIKYKIFTLEQRFIIIPSVCRVVDWCVRFVCSVYMSALFYVRTIFN